MAEYAKMEDVLNALCTCECEDKKECLDYVLISNVPTIDIVHCKDCVYRHKYEEYDRLNDEMIEGYECLRGIKNADANWFCADGFPRTYHDATSVWVYDEEKHKFVQMKGYNNG